MNKEILKPCPFCGRISDDNEFLKRAQHSEDLLYNFYLGKITKDQLMKEIEAQVKKALF